MEFGSVELIPCEYKMCCLPALQAWRGPALPHLGCLQHQAAAIAAGPTSDQDLQAVVAHLAKQCWLGTRDGVNHFVSKDGSALELLSGHPVLKDEEAVFAEAMERQWIGIYPHISLALINCQEFKVPVLTPDLRVASGLTKFTRKDFSEGSISILGELALSLDDFGFCL